VQGGRSDKRGLGAQECESLGAECRLGLAKTEGQKRIAERNWKKQGRCEINMAREQVDIGLPGFIEIMPHGIPKGSSIIVAGGPGSGKTLFCLNEIGRASCRERV
jgi:RecA/RadA recombinase